MSRNGSTYHRLLNSAAWRRLRAAQLESAPFCADCHALGVLTPATEVHHAVAVEETASPEAMRLRAYDPANLVSLCASCHAERHRRMKSAGRRRQNAEARAEEETRAFWERFAE